MSETAFLKVSGMSMTVGLTFDVLVTSAIWRSRASLHSAGLILNLRIPGRLGMTASTSVVLPTRLLL